MSHMIIDGRKVEFTDEKNVLSVIRKAGINIPTLCYHSELSTFGACRLCTVEDDRGKMFASCSEEPRDGMVIHTNSGRIRKYRKLIVELLLAAHCRDCTTCVKSGECVLQELAHRLGVENVRFQNTREQRELDLSSPSLVRDRINVSFVETVSAPVKNCRVSVLLDLHSVVPKRWLCRRLTGRFPQRTV